MNSDNLTQNNIYHPHLDCMKNCNNDSHMHFPNDFSTELFATSTESKKMIVMGLESLNEHVDSWYQNWLFQSIKVRIRPERKSP